MSWRDLRSLLGTVVGAIPTTVFFLLVVGGLGLLSLGAAHFAILKGDPVVTFVCLGGMFFLALEAVDLLGELRK